MSDGNSKQTNLRLSPEATETLDVLCHYQGLHKKDCVGDALAEYERCLIVRDPEYQAVRPALVRAYRNRVRGKS